MYFYILLFNPYALTQILTVKPLLSPTLSDQICLQRHKIPVK